MSQEPTYIGIDVSKDQVDVAVRPTGMCYTSIAMILCGPSRTGSDPHVNWLKCPQMDMSIRSKGGP